MRNRHPRSGRDAARDPGRPGGPGGPGGIVVLTGAGISKESGLDTFRCADGIWAKVNLEDVATPEGFRRNPPLVHEFYNQRRRRLNDPAIRPNAAHTALARLEAEWPDDVFVVTQNIDDLHERAGSQNVLHMHGELRKIRCEACETIRDWSEDLSVDHACPSCGQVRFLRPHVVWFGEMPIGMDAIYRALDRCTLFVSVGTSGSVYPAASFVSHVRMYTRAHSVELNLEPSSGATLFAETLYGPASQIVPAFVDRLLATVA
ncbi:MAG: Sir2 family NAD+-dependent deacetylase [Rhodospirillales bacterium]